MRQLLPFRLTSGRLRATASRRQSRFTPAWPGGRIGGPVVLSVVLIHFVTSTAAAGPPSFDCRPLAPPAEIQFGVLAGDWNGDGMKDLAVSYLDKRFLGLFLNRGGRRFEHVVNAPTGDVPRGIAAGDADGDGAVDFAVGNATSNDVTLILGDGKGGFSTTAPLLTGMSPFEPAFADFDGDGHLDLVSVNETNPGVEMKGQVRVLFGGKGPGLPRHSGGGVFNDKLTLTAGVHPADLAVGDFDGKNGPDFAVVSWMSASISVFLHQGGRKFSAAADIETGGQLTYSIFAADFDGNGTLDLAVSAVHGPAVHTFAGDGHGGFKPAGTYPVGTGVRWVAGGDLDGDGDVDLVTANTGAHTISMLMGDGKGGFAKAVDVGVGRGPRVVLADDLDGDGKVDLAVSHGRSPAVMLLWQTTGEAKACPQNQTEG